LSVHIRGAKELEHVLKQLPTHIAERVLKNAVRAGANVIRDEAKQLAPVSSESHRNWKGRTVPRGILRASIKTMFVKHSKSSVAFAVGLSRKSWGFYGRFLEFGTSKMKPSPWLRPAFDAKGREALDAIGKALGRGIERAAKRLAGPLRRSGLKLK